MQFLYNLALVLFLIALSWAVLAGAVLLVEDVARLVAEQIA